MSEALGKLLSTEHLFEPNPGPPTAYYGIVGFFFALILGTSLSLYLRRTRLFAARPTLLKLITRASTVGIALGAVGMILVLARFFAVPVLSMRGLLYMCVIVTLGLAGYLAYYIRGVYPRQEAVYRQELVRARYLPKPAPKPAGRKKKGKRRK